MIDKLEPVVSVSFTSDEANGLISLLDLVVKAHGLHVAKQAIYYQDKIAETFVQSRMEEKVNDLQGQEVQNA